MNFGLSTIGQVTLTISNIEKAKSFYSDKLGLRLFFQFGNLAFYDCGGVRLMLSTPEAAVPENSRSTIYFRVADINYAYETLSSRGVKFVGAPHLIAKMDDHDLWMAFFNDPDNNSLALMCEAPKGYKPE